MTLSTANTAGEYKVKLMFIYHSKNPKALKNYVNSTLPELHKQNKARMTTYPFTEWCTEHFKPTVETYCSEKKDSKYHCSLTMHLGQSPESSDGGGQ